ncbi:hypothetical protein F5H01DRAFT_338724 [Linnemannia elongata]|nr:hypothetical protein F5H01DRAFT_338724 [Linnemannia elongata]
MTKHKQKRIGYKAMPCIFSPSPSSCLSPFVSCLSSFPSSHDDKLNPPCLAFSLSLFFFCCMFLMGWSILSTIDHPSLLSSRVSQMQCCLVFFALFDPPLSLQLISHSTISTMAHSIMKYYKLRTVWR